MKRIHFFFLAVLFAWGCEEQRPADLLPEPKMRGVLYDLLRADELSAQYLLRDSAWAGMDKRAPLYQEVFQVHGVTKEQFQRTLAYYEAQPQEMKKLIEQLSAEVEEAQRKGDTSEARPVRQRDTTRKKLLPTQAQ